MDKIMKRYLLFLLLSLQLPVAAQIRITHGPWLTDMSENGVTIMWKTDKPAMAWVEYDEYVGNTFYSKYHPVAYDSKDGNLDLRIIESEIKNKLLV